MFRSSKYGNAKLTSIHLDDRKPRGKYIFSNLNTINDTLLRVCIRNTLCIYEKACSKKIGLRPGKYKKLVNNDTVSNVVCI